MSSTHTFRVTDPTMRPSEQEPFDLDVDAPTRTKAAAMVRLAGYAIAAR